MASLRRSISPEYFMRPSQALRRLARRSRKGVQVVRLPWHAEIECDTREYIGYRIWTRGLYDLAACEALWRLVKPGDTAFDVGANIGQMSSLLALRVGPKGSVHAVEPHPTVLERLAGNVIRWKGQSSMGPIVTHGIALSDTPGRLRMAQAADFADNMGTSYISNSGDIEIEAKTLDDLVGDGSIGVLKLDVERHEVEVLTGAAKLLESGRIRDILFEDHDPYPSPAMTRLEEHGYAVFGLGSDLFGPTISPGNQQAGQPLNWIATNDPDRLLRVMRPRGWRCLRG